MPGVAGFYNTNGLPMPGNDTSPTTTATATTTTQSQPNNNAFYASSQPTSYPIYPDSSISQSPFNTAPSPSSPTFNVKPNTADGSTPSMSSTQQQQQHQHQHQQSQPQPPPPPPASSSIPVSTDQQPQNPFAGPLFDPSDPALFNFDLSSMNFENRYGAMEFGMLGHLATGAGDSPSDSTQRGSISGNNNNGATVPYSAAAGTGFGGGENTNSPGGSQPFMFNADSLLGDWSGGQASGQQHVNVSSGVYQNNNLNHNATSNNVLAPHMSVKPDGPHAFAIESHPGSFTSPASIDSPQIPTVSTLGEGPFGTRTHSNGLATSGHQRPGVNNNMPAPDWRHPGAHAGIRRRHRNPSAIYESVKEPYSYTNGFHSLTAFIQRRFPPQKTLQIAKALASIRPSFIATTKTLNRDDLVFMEKCFQRTLWEYEDFINACGTPTLVLRRTGEVAAVGKEFSILTGWKKEVLLGKEPNLNVNTGGSGPHLGALSRSGSLPSLRNSGSGSDGGRTQPVFLAELLDDESVVEFYEDFARLAFGDSRGSVMTTCNLLKYKTQEDMEMAQSEEDQHKWKGHMRKGGIAGESGMNQLGTKDGKVECACCWTVKRDVFDIPMLIVMNVSIPSSEFSNPLCIG